MASKVARIAGLLVAATLGSAGLGFAGPSAAAQAKKTPPKQPPVSSEPGATTATYGDWVLRCLMGGAPDKPQRVCEVGQSMQVQGQNSPIAQIAFTRTGSGGLAVLVVLPNNVSFPSQVYILRSEKDTAGEAIDWRRCLPGRCVAEAAVKDDALAQWRAAGAGRITFLDAAGRRLAIPLSFRGLAQALDALDREAARKGGG